MKRKGKMEFFCLQRRFNSSKNIVSAVVRGLISALTHLKNIVSAVVKGLIGALTYPKNGVSALINFKGCL